jgi:cell division protein ZapA
VNDKKHSVRVQILGEEYTLRTAAPADETRAVAQYFDAAVREVMGAGMVVETHRAAILAALQITAELFQAREASADNLRDMKSLSADLRRLLPPAKRGDGAA